MTNLFAALSNFIRPVVIAFTSLAGFVAFLVGALADPQGLMNQTVCGAIDFIASLFPSTPDNLKIGTLINGVADSMPSVGRGIIKDTFSTIVAIALVALIIKIYKLLPFKFS